MLGRFVAFLARLLQRFAVRDGNLIYWRFFVGAELMIASFGLIPIACGLLLALVCFLIRLLGVFPLLHHLPVRVPGGASLFVLYCE